MYEEKDSYRLKAYSDGAFEIGGEGKLDNVVKVYEIVNLMSSCRDTREDLVMDVACLNDLTVDLALLWRWGRNPKPTLDRLPERNVEHITSMFTRGYQLAVVKHSDPTRRIELTRPVYNRGTDL